MNARALIGGSLLGLGLIITAPSEVSAQWLLWKETFRPERGDSRWSLERGADTKADCLIVAGTPEAVTRCAQSHTGKALRGHLKGR